MVGKGGLPRSVFMVSELFLQERQFYITDLQRRNSACDDSAGSRIIRFLGQILLTPIPEVK